MGPSPEQNPAPAVAQEAPRRSYQLFFVDYIIYLAIYLYAVIHRPDKISLLGSVIAVPAFALWLVAKLQLGSSFSVTAQARKLVTRGLYSRFRHPIYFFGGIAIFATALCLRWWPFTILAIMGNLYQFVRIRKESAVLAAKFGEEYAAYRRQTWF